MSTSPLFAVVLAGCGVYDGSEIHEATLTLYAIKKLNANYQVFAPDIDQLHVVNHLNGEVKLDKRNVLEESARLARGKVRPLSEYRASQFDGIIFPGGFGVAKNLCSYAIDGNDFTVNSEVEKVINETAQLQKPIGALCISPVLITKVLSGITVTVGNDSTTIKSIESLGGKHIKSTSGEVVVDPLNKIVTTPCYMLDATIDQIGDGALNLVKEMIRLRNS